MKTAATLISVSLLLGAARATAQDLASPEAPPPPPSAPPATYPSVPPAPYSPPTFVYVEPPTPPRPPRFTFKIDGGFRYSNLYSSHIAGGEIEAAFGARRGEERVNSLYGTLSAALGTTRFGLSTRRYGLGFLWEHSIDRFRFGAGVGLALWDMSRVTSSSTMWAVGLAPRIGGSVDLYRTPDDHALYLGLRAALDIYIVNVDGDNIPALAPGLTLGLGYRY